MKPRGNCSVTKEKPFGIRNPTGNPGETKESPRGIGEKPKEIYVNQLETRRTMARNREGPEGKAGFSPS